METIGYLLKCPLCKEQFIICKHCYCGQVYCSKECSNIARVTSLKEAKKRYSSSKKGKINQYERNQRYLEKKRKNDEIKKNVTEQSSQENFNHVSNKNINVGPDEKQEKETCKTAEAQVCSCCGRKINYLFPFVDELGPGLRKFRAVQKRERKEKNYD